ncbi:hypothetical protein [Anaerotalea alkaliphila]|uniref:Uncharacterized protein n=1 Tax=Anaerotalea alkaliphila TaxID=2662126 RepID=A0A7X5KPP2_9FIRM|nr:hypothetical protein [Anaerotalea alkaliphila]NDL68492.1 hypothetical protein [Anaerotalea alkaliphila]
MTKIVFIHVNEEGEEFEAEAKTDLPMELVISMAMEKIPMATGDIMFVPVRVMCVDLDDGQVELECEIG